MNTNTMLTTADTLKAGSALTLKAKALTDAIAYAESNFGKNMRSSGWHGMTHGAWADVSQQRKTAGKAPLDYLRCTDYADSSEYSAHYLSVLWNRFYSITERNPKLEDLLACYNIGLEAYRRQGWEWRKLPPPFATYVRNVRSHLNTGGVK